MTMNCRSLAHIAPERVPWHSCVAAACQLNFAIADGLIMISPMQERIALRKLCPRPGSPP
jgi:hypothetical protein